MEIENRLEVSRVKEEGGCDYKRATGEILMMMKMFYILTVSMSISWL